MHDVDARFRTASTRRALRVARHAARLRLPDIAPLTDQLPDIPLPLLVTGVAGVAGYNAFHAFRQRYGEAVLGQRPVNNWRLRGPGIVACNLEDTESVRRLVQCHGFRSVLSCGGSCALKSCELDPEMAHRVNVFALQNLLDAFDDQPVRLVHLSIDLVFSGNRNGGYVETDPVDPVTVYGRTMADGEDLIRSRRPDACILRISLPMGISFNGHAGAIDWIQSRFAAGRPATLYFDEVRTPTYVECLNRVFARALAAPLSGTFHAGGPRRLSLYQIAQVVNRVGGYDPRLLRGCMRIEAGPVPPRAGNVTLDSSKLARSLGDSLFDRWPLDDTHFPDHPEWHFERDAAVAGSRELLRQSLYSKPHRAGSQVD
jgi:dTDP-4-dehydrorhamnose reductase